MKLFLLFQLSFDLKFKISIWFGLCVLSYLSVSRIIKLKFPFCHFLKSVFMFVFYKSEHSSGLQNDLEEYYDQRIQVIEYK